MYIEFTLKAYLIRSLNPLQKHALTLPLFSTLYLLLTGCFKTMLIKKKSSKKREERILSIISTLFFPNWLKKRKKRKPVIFLKVLKPNDTCNMMSVP